MQAFAHDVFKEITSGPGTPHARMRRLEQILNELARENYLAGEAKGNESAAPVPAETGQQVLPGVAATPPPPCSVCNGTGFVMPSGRRCESSGCTAFGPVGGQA